MTAIGDRETAAKEQPENPWVYLGLAKAHMINGYRPGSRFEADNFDQQSLASARALVDHALEIDPALSRGHAMRARLQIIGGEYRQAWDTLNRTHELDKQDFHPWYLMGVLNRFYGEYDQSRKMLHKAQAAALHPHQVRWILDQKREIAEDTDDPVAEEAVHREVIASFPDRAYSYGNYGAFLLEQDRYRDAIEQFEKALSIQRYPLAERQLEKARRKLGGG